jgi:hypothetical protein
MGLLKSEWVFISKTGYRCCLTVSTASKPSHMANAEFQAEKTPLLKLANN